MPFSFFNRRVAAAVFVASFIVALMVLPARAQTTYTDAIGDNYGGPEVDISNVVISNDASNIYFMINMSPSADLTTNYYANYEVGIQENGGVGGQTAINGTYGTGVPAAGNPYGNAVGISTGENYFIGSFLNAPTYSGGAELYSYSSSGGWSQVGSTAPITEVGTVTPYTSFAFALSSLGLSVGSSFEFDVWTSFGSPQGAYDALDNTTGTPNGPGGTIPPYNSGGTYDSATASGSVLASYTVTAVPEPCSLVIAAMGGCGLLAFCVRRRASKQ
jgi:hypothetical protein